MSAMERGSFVWFMMAVTQIWLSLKLMDEVNSAITTLFGTGAAAFFLIGMVMFREEQREVLLNPLKPLNKEVHQEQIDKQGKGIWIGVVIWLITIVMGSLFF